MAQSPQRDPLIDRVLAYTADFLRLRLDMCVEPSVGFGHVNSIGQRGNGTLLVAMGETQNPAGYEYDGGRGEYVPVDRAKGDLILIEPNLKKSAPSLVSLADSGIQFLDQKPEVVAAGIAHQLAQWIYIAHPERYISRISPTVGAALPYFSAFKYPTLSVEAMADVMGAGYVGYDAMLGFVDFLQERAPHLASTRKEAKAIDARLNARYELLDTLQKKKFEPFE